MTAILTGIAIVLLLAFAALVSLLSSLGLLVMRGFYDKLHYLAPPAVLSTAAVVSAILLREGLTSAGIKSLLVLLVMVVSNPMLTHAAARAQHVRDTRGNPDKGD